VRRFEDPIRRAYLRLARGLLARDDGDIGRASRDLGFIGPSDDPAPMVAILHVVCEPLERDAPYDPRDYDIVERGTRVAQLAIAHRVFRSPGHRVFLLRALVGLDAYLRALGSVRNWHRLFGEVVAAIPAEGTRG
jgi:hypothetical protein